MMIETLARTRVVLDTNLVISAFLRPDGGAGQALVKALLHCEVLASAETLRELEMVLGRKKFDRYLSPAQRLDRMQAYRAAVRQVDVHSVVTACQDPKDNKFLALALDAGASMLVSGDKRDLLVMECFQGVRIMSIRAFLGSGPDGTACSA